MHLKNNIFWHNGSKLESDDIIFTLKAIQDPLFQSPLRSSFQGVAIEKINNLSFKFILKNPYAPFLHSLTFGILPKHIWQNVEPENFPLAEANLKPIGTGPFKFKNLEKDKQGNIYLIELEQNKNYFQKKPYLEKITLKFFDSEENLIQAYQLKTILGLGYISAQNKDKIQNNLEIYKLEIPRYFSVFFNQNRSKILASQKIRQALNLAVNKQEIIQQVFKNQAKTMHVPLPEYYKFSQEFDREKAINILINDSWISNDQGIRQKKDDLLEFSLVTTDWPELVQTAEVLKNQWEQIGVKVEVIIDTPMNVQTDYLRPREYDALLFGEALGFEPDLFAFWHSSQKKDPGLNLALYDNIKADKLLVDLRGNLENNIKEDKYKELQKLLIQDNPAIFLFNPYYLYGVNRKVQGIELEKIQGPQERFNNIHKWYIKTKTVRE
tara:strand:- start:4399 stop:5712 length:1314 start_codon:yes stop_codon:yes gene_type:complete